MKANRRKSMYETFEGEGPPPYERTWDLDHQGETYTLYYGDFLKIKKNKLTLKVIYGRLTNGWDLFDAINAPREVRKEDYDEYIKLKLFEHRARLAKKKREQAKLDKKTWLIEFPQSVPASKWYLHLCKYDIWPKQKRGIRS